MVVVHRVLGQDAPATGQEQALRDLYTVGGGTTTVVSSLVVANRGGSAAWFRALVARNGEVSADKHYIAYDVDVLTKESVAVAHGVTMDTDDVLRIYASNNQLSFGLFGQENG